MIPYLVSDGVYPFDNILGTVYADKEEPHTALSIAIQRFGGHPTVEPINE